MSDGRNVDKKSLLSRSYAAFGEFYFGLPTSSKVKNIQQYLRQAENYLVKSIKILEDLQKQNPLKKSDMDNLEKWQKELQKIRLDLEKYEKVGNFTTNN